MIIWIWYKFGPSVEHRLDGLRLVRGLRINLAEGDDRLLVLQRSTDRVLLSVQGPNHWRWHLLGILMVRTDELDREGVPLVSRFVADIELVVAEDVCEPKVLAVGYVLNHDEVTRENARKHVLAAFPGRLRDAGLLEMEGKGTETYYEPTEKLLGSLSSQGDLFDEDETQITQAEEEVTQAEDKPAQAEDKTTQLEQETNCSSGNIPNHLQKAIQEWGRKSNAEAIERIILELCRWQPLSSLEIAEYVDRDRRHLNRTYIRPLVEEGKLERTRPDAPRSPNQRYRTFSDALNNSTE